MEERQNDTAQVVLAGLVAGLAFVAEEIVDRRLVPGTYSDMKLLGTSITQRSPWWQISALLWHEANSVLYAFAYSRYIAPDLPGPRWLRGLLSALIENIVLWPLIYAANLVHPAIRRGTMPPIGGGRDFAAGLLRHAAFGLVLGALCPVRAPKRR